MNAKRNAAVCVLLSIAGVAGVAVAAGKKPEPAPANDASSAAVTVDDKTLRKLSMGIGEEIEDFTVVKAEEVESSAGTKSTQYTVLTNGGKKYKCDVMQLSKFGRIASWGMNAEIDAMCTEFSGTSQPAVSNKATAGSSGGGASRKAADAKASTSTPAAAVALDAKNLRKISMAIGEEVEDFTVVKEEEIESSAGTKGMQYTVLTDGGKKYKCDIIGLSKFGKIASWGMNAEMSAMCTDFTSGSKDKGKTNQASCNQLLRAAGKC